MRKTKIMGTIGPASDDQEVLRTLIQNGLDVIRLNFSHIGRERYGYAEDLIKFIRKTADECGGNVAIFQDLGGIKLRIGTISADDGIVQFAHGGSLRPGS